MPTYCYQFLEGPRRGKIEELVMSVDEMQEFQDRNGCGRIDGFLVQRSFSAERPGANSHMSSNWPMKSEAAAVHPSQIGEATEFYRNKGVPTSFDRLGRPVLESRAHRKAFLRASGLHDRDGGVGD
jgi:hypothetical protein